MVAGATVMLLVVSASFVIDLGMQRVVRRDMQALADVVAFDLSRQLDGRRASVILGSSSWSDALDKSVERNSTTLGDEPVVEAEVGEVSATTGAFAPYGATDPRIPTAVRVTATGNVGFALPIVSDEGGATRSAVATQRRQACIKLGSYAAAVEGGRAQLLAGLTDQLGLDITAVGYQGLVDAAVGIDDLATELGLGSPSELSTATVSYGELLAATAAVLDQNGETEAAATIAGAVATLGANANQTLVFGELVEVAAGSGSALNANLDVIDLVTGGVFLINGDSLLSVPGLTASLRLLSATSALTLIEGPRTKCGFRGETTVETSQAELTVRGNLTTTTRPATGVGIGVSSPPGRPVTLSIELARATGSLDDVRCPRTTGTMVDDSFGASIGVTSGLSSVTLTVPVRVSARVNILGIGLVNVTADVTLTVTNNSAIRTNTVTVAVPPQNFDEAYASGTGELRLSASSAASSVAAISASTLLGIPVVVTADIRGAVLDSVISSVVNPLVNAVNDEALVPLGDLLGIGVGGADVFLLGPRVVCDSPALRG